MPKSLCEGNVMSEAHKIGTKVRRLPGQSLREELDERFDKKVLFPFLAAGMGVMALISESIHAFFNVKPNVGVWATISLTLIVYAAVSIYRNFNKFKSIRRGEQGELIVAQIIERDLLPNGYVVFHDVQLEDGKKRFNIDHLLIGPNGVFVIETKNYSKPKRGEVKVSYDGKRVRWNGVAHKEDEARQAVAIAMAAKDFIFKETGVKVYVKPVLCAVGWYAVSDDLFRHPALLLMEKQLGTIIPKVYPKVQLSEQDHNLIIAKLSSL